MHNDVINFQSSIVGDEFEVPVLNGTKIRYVNLDNAASTPPFKRVIDKVNEFSRIYSSVHRGNGFKSLISTEIYEETRNILADFVGADIFHNALVFVKNSTEAINTIANCYKLKSDDIVISTEMEHHSNDLPWRKVALVKYIKINEKGELDLEHFKYLLDKYGQRIKLVTITGASNVTGYINPIHYLASLTHMVGAKILVDASQLAPHKKIDIKSNDDLEHIDFLVFTAHKIYAPFGTGVLIGPREFFNVNDPNIVGGGTVKIVTDTKVYWDETPEKNEAGTPNIIGAVALASSVKFMNNIGMHKIEKHESTLTEYLVKGLSKLDKIEIYGQSIYECNKRLGVVSFNMKGIHHSMLASILSYEYGIGVRNGCFCAHPYVLRLLNINEDEVEKHIKNVLAEDKSQLPGLVRVSLGIYNTKSDIDRLLTALDNISRGNYNKDYILDKKHGAYKPKKSIISFKGLFEF